MEAWTSNRLQEMLGFRRFKRYPLVTRNQAYPYSSVEPNRHRWRHSPKGPKLARAPQQEVDPGQEPVHLHRLENYTELTYSLPQQEISMKPSSLQPFYFSVTNQFSIKILQKNASNDRYSVYWSYGEKVVFSNWQAIDWPPAFDIFFVTKNLVFESWVLPQK